MFKMVKSSMVLSFVLAMTLVFAACGTAEKSTTNPSASTQAQSTIAPSQKPAETVELTVSAAASMTDALKDIQKAYETKNPTIKLNFNFGASGALQQQIEQGAPADLFLSAATKNMKALVDKQLIDTNQQKKLLTNELVAVIASDAKAPIGNVGDLSKAEVKNVAIGIPESVPAGSYAKEALTNTKLWDSLQSKMVQGKDVRQVLQYVETGNADVGFVYKTDALTSQKVKVAFAVDPKTYTPVEYPIGIVKATKHSKEAEGFYTYLQSKEALDVFVKYGFTTLN
ncbi:molybdate ABC transporter substrate-binding protein [Paenibacillus aceris]|uniref:Molybdate transport system substrate-binding protein n=1 Tax=Paenibacillus aceris TaxID=869555 RepID=A0ABS4I3I5_9BACL|nr:molybdate ABC transporter substrate-binding protein [Paenibacillus aceris]MBP1965462.1 molybdate transport system substrate-binding protein [Paenibacillus aceris]NHW33488.1 molybdate ABC transporter substrate-binding protein [Paenibacillus aceris]